MTRATSKTPLIMPHCLSAAKFVLIAAVLGFIFVAGLDLVQIIRQNVELNAALNAATSHGMVNIARVQSEDGSVLAHELALQIASAVRPGTSIKVTLNNGPTARLLGDGSTHGAIIAEANMCWCPGVASGGIIDRGALGCGSACASSGPAGQFVAVSLSQPFRPVLFDYGLTVNGALSAAAVVRTE
ncbi:hypothetical protein [Devosia sp. FKR38]|uniref:hypothetical protein n=1 Tax=Devosia sp. FKR38 TaxID=2562312 RepID=UPI0010BFF4F2|nr:hypothetical protein [Devosia sp. FKR38]